MISFVFQSDPDPNIKSMTNQLAKIESQQRIGYLRTSHELCCRLKSLIKKREPPIERIESHVRRLTLRCRREQLASLSRTRLATGERTGWKKSPPLRHAWKRQCVFTSIWPRVTFGRPSKDFPQISMGLGRGKKYWRSQTRARWTHLTA